MKIAILVKTGLIIIGLVIMLLTFILHSKKKLTVNLSVAWEAIGIGLILIGAIPMFSSWCYLLAEGTAIAMFLVGGFTIWGGFRLSILISTLVMKTQELAIQVSLLNQENERIMEELCKLTGKSKREL